MNTERPPGLPPLGGMNVPLGVWLLARGRGIGINCFGLGLSPFMGALAPTLAMAIIAFALTFQLPSAQWGVGLVRALVPLTCTLLQLVVSHFFARLVRREGLWLRYATASLWCAWLPLILVFLLGGVLKIFMPSGALTPNIMMAVSVLVQVYGLWLSWYVSKVGLLIRGVQASAIVVAQIAAVAFLLVLIFVLPPHYSALADMLSVN